MADEIKNVVEKDAFHNGRLCQLKVLMIRHRSIEQQIEGLTPTPSTTLCRLALALSGCFIEITLLIGLKYEVLTVVRDWVSNALNYALEGFASSGNKLNFQSESSDKSCPETRSTRKNSSQDPQEPIESNESHENIINKAKELLNLNHQSNTLLTPDLERVETSPGAFVIRLLCAYGIAHVISDQFDTAVKILKEAHKYSYQLYLSFKKNRMDEKSQLVERHINQCLTSLPYMLLANVYWLLGNKKDLALLLDDSRGRGQHPAMTYLTALHYWESGQFEKVRCLLEDNYETLELDRWRGDMKACMLVVQGKPHHALCKFTQLATCDVMGSLLALYNAVILLDNIGDYNAAFLLGEQLLQAMKIQSPSVNHICIPPYHICLIPTDSKHSFPQALIQCKSTTCPFSIQQLPFKEGYVMSLLANIACKDRMYMKACSIYATLLCIATGVDTSLDKVTSLKLGPIDIIDIVIEYSYVLLSARRWDDCVVLVDSVLVADISYIPLLQDKCECYLQLGKYDRVVEIGQCVLELLEGERGRETKRIRLGDPNDFMCHSINQHKAMTYNNMGLAYLALDNSRCALMAFRTACQLVPECTPSHYNYTLALATVGRLVEAGMIWSTFRDTYYEIPPCAWLPPTNPPMVLDSLDKLAIDWKQL